MTGLTAAERVLFVVASNNASTVLREVGGSLLRLLESGGMATVVYGTGSDGASQALEGELAALGVDSVWYLEGVPHVELPSVFETLDPDAVVVAGIDPHSDAATSVRESAVRCAEAAGIPAYIAVPARDPAHGVPTTQIDIRAVREAKWRSLARLDSASGAPPSSGTAEELSAVEGFVTVRPSPKTAPVAAEQRPSRGSRIVSCALAAGVGVTFGTLGTIMHGAVWEWGSVSIPWGLIVSLGVIAALLAGLRLILEGRVVAVCAAIGVVVTVFVLSLRSAGGSVLVPDGIPGQIWSIAPALIAVVILSWPDATVRPKPGVAAVPAGQRPPEA